jgi:hypothetical protein
MLVVTIYNASRYRIKFTIFIQSVVVNQLHRLESIPEFPMNAFLEILYKYTFQQVGNIYIEIRIFNFLPHRIAEYSCHA